MTQGQVLTENGLSRREREVLLQLQEGLTNRQIAERLGISANTVNKHVQKVLRKLGVGNRVLAVMHAQRTRPAVPDSQYLVAIEGYVRLNLVESVRTARIEYAEALDAQGRSREAKDQWKLAALADRETPGLLTESPGWSTA